MKTQADKGTLLFFEFLSSLVRRDLEVSTQKLKVKDNVEYYLQKLGPYLDFIEEYNLAIPEKILEEYAEDINFLLEKRKSKVKHD